VTSEATSDEVLAGQVLMPYAFGNGATEVDAASAAANRKLAGVDTPAELVEKFRPGGIILVGFAAEDPTGATNPATNVENPEQVRALTDGLRTAAGGPLLIGTDQEYGVVTRVREGVTMLPSALGLGAAARPELTERAWGVAGAELAAMGINVDFAPVADTLGPGGSAVIGSRAFGADPAANSAQVAAAVRGLRGAGVAGVLKHFPGHGHTTADSHKELPVVSLSRAEWERLDRPPFAAGIAAGAPLVMSGHLDVPAIDPGVPATFSAKVMTGVLRDELKFGGVAVTDAMNMAPAMKWAPGEAAVRALLAGNDLVLMPPDVTAARDGILAALRDGRLPRARLVEAAGRVRALTASLGATPPLEGVGSAGHHRTVREAAAAAITLLRGKCGGPLVTGPVTVTASGGREAARAALTEALRTAGVEIGAGSVVHLVGYGDKRSDLDPAAAVTVIMDKPGLLADSASPTLIATYSSSPLSMSALADVLAGKAKAPGKSPVAIPGLPRSACP
jgi:beta-N-acetylhexosaminidase